MKYRFTFWLEEFRRYLRRLGHSHPSDEDLIDVIDSIDLAYCCGETRLGRAGLRRLNLYQLLRAADHFIRRKWGKNGPRYVDDFEWTSPTRNPLCYIRELVGKRVVNDSIMEIDHKCCAAYEELQKSLAG